MPLNKEKMRKYMRKYRKDKRQVLIPQKKLDQLQKQFPTAYDLLFKPKTKRRKKK